MDEYETEKIRDAMDETTQVPESIYFFYGGDSEQSVNALKFIGLSPINREFCAFLLSDLGRQTMILNKLSIHVETGEIFYDNHNTGENFYNFLLSQQNDEAAYVYISSFLQSFSMDDQEKFDLLAFKNSKYLFYRFNSFLKAYGNPRYKLLHTRKMLDTVGLQKVEEKNKQFLLEKITHGIEFENLYPTDSERKPEIISTIEGNYRIARRVYQQLHLDTPELFADVIRSVSVFEQRDMDEDIRANGWGIKKISEVSDSQKMFKIFQDFYSLTGRLPLSNSLLVVPDGDAPPEEKLNMRHLYDLFKNTNSYGVVSLPFLGLIQFYLEENDHTLIKNAISELYQSLSYITLSGARDFQFDAISDLTARLFVLLKHATLGNKRLREIENEQITKKINEERVFEPKIEDSLDDVLEIIDMPDLEHKKSMFPYVEPTVETADEIDTNQEKIDTDFINLQNEFNKLNDVATEQNKTKENRRHY